MRTVGIRGNIPRLRGSDCMGAWDASCQAERQIVPAWRARQPRNLGSHGQGSKLQYLGFRVQGLGFRVSGLGRVLQSPAACLNRVAQMPSIIAHNLPQW